MVSIHVALRRTQPPYLATFAYSDTVADFIKGSFEFLISPEVLCVLLDFFYQFLCRVVVGEGKVVYHAVEGKVVAYDYSAWGQIFFILLKKLDVLGFCGINENQVELSISKIVG